MSADLGIGAASMGIALVALGAAVMQVTMAVDVEERRKGKTDRLALGDWAIDWPQLKLLIHVLCRAFWLQSPWGDPRELTVPFITVGEIEKYLFAESAAASREDLHRRMKDRLVESATKAFSAGDGRYTGRMYAVRETTRKSCEACWSDAMNMCGLTRRHWSLLTRVSAQPCDGVIRPANAVTNLHSLWGFGRVMGLRQVICSGSRITMTNGGASLYLDLYAGVDRPIRLAHFSGSPNGRYMIIEEMSQHTAQSVYADAVWAAGCVPNPIRLSPTAKALPGPNPSRTSLSLPDAFTFSTEKKVTCHIDDKGLAEEFYQVLSSSPKTDSNAMNLLELVGSSAILPCIRTYPVGKIPERQLRACYAALLWCTRNWGLCPILSTSRDLPSLPFHGTTYIGPEFVTNAQQARAWSRMMDSNEFSLVPVNEQAWPTVVEYAERKAEDADDKVALNNRACTIAVKLLQIWKLAIWSDLQSPASDRSSDSQRSVLTARLAAVTMASIAVATDSTIIGDDEENKAMEIELGCAL
ncbi:hypothetical protein GLOTRDRAFT_130571 [Gloeophyllum trabeum ATCC 11539]|uniref:Uncharacterized protein n=1 Tax=Gloeophyllum trabeum (strain ATCC 11539 / FP-39264 / Madison 617) TaxID=670483 RepID=S7Q3Z6_GLOTA|nr:uncharacterized protein GLOTRDRAFT_130571 [Gloeophyllum trabeum ATCC 11539]EPQ54188.1 hypothetical protein GLOTRDRAFT_130571 [Gloeophyllum trabeum ATCC 11539]